MPIAWPGGRKRMEGIYDETALKDLQVQAFGLQSDSRQDFGVDAERAR